MFPNQTEIEFPYLKYCQKTWLDIIPTFYWVQAFPNSTFRELDEMVKEADSDSDGLVNCQGNINKVIHSYH